MPFGKKKSDHPFIFNHPVLFNSKIKFIYKKINLKKKTINRKA
jgi:hypothetical protein